MRDGPVARPAPVTPDTSYGGESGYPEEAKKHVTRRRRGRGPSRKAFGRKERVCAR